MKHEFEIKNISLNSLLSVLVFSFALATNAQNLDKIPDGYQAGRADAPYGTYTSPVKEYVRPFQERISTIEKKIFGLALPQDINVVELAQQAYLLEHEILRIQKDISEVPFEKITEFEKQSLLNSTMHAYRNLRTTSERQFEDMIRFIDKAFPGPNGGQFRVNDQGAIKNVRYQPNYRIDTLLSPVEQQKAYDKQLAKVVSEGYKPEQIITLDKKLFQSLTGFNWFEYAALDDGTVKITKGNAGHIILSDGGLVRSAGQIVVHNDANGKPLAFVITNASGSFKPDIISAELVAQDLIDKLDIPENLVVVTKGEPFSVQTIKIYLKGKKQDKAIIDTSIATLKDKAKAIMNLPNNHKNDAKSCTQMISSLITGS